MAPRSLSCATYLRANGVARSYHGTQRCSGRGSCSARSTSARHTPNPAAHPAIVDPRTWRRVQRTTVSARPPGEVRAAPRAPRCLALRHVRRADGRRHRLNRLTLVLDLPVPAERGLPAARHDQRGDRRGGWWSTGARSAIADDEGRASDGGRRSATRRPRSRPPRRDLEVRSGPSRWSRTSLRRNRDCPVELRQDRDRAREHLDQLRRPAKPRSSSTRADDWDRPVLRRPPGADPRHRRARHSHHGRAWRRAHPRSNCSASSRRASASRMRRTSARTWTGSGLTLPPHARSVVLRCSIAASRAGAVPALARGWTPPGARRRPWGSRSRRSSRR